MKPDERDLFSLCVICNCALEGIDKASVRGEVPPYVYDTNETFMRCPECMRIYWKGTHWRLAKEFLEKIHV
jgi:uncharacterized protein with PIN domain